MDVQLPIDRLTRSVVAALVLSGISFCYMNFSSWWFDVQRNQGTKFNPSAPVVMNSVADESVLKWFPENAWVRQAHNSVRNGRQFLFWNEDDQKEIAPTGSSEIPGLKIGLKPIAIVWKDEDPGAAPIVTTADSARVTLSERFSLQNSTVGRIVSGWLTGNVVIQGPNGLHITGHEFYVDEMSMNLRSRQPVEFRWDGHIGRAEGGVEIALERDSEDGNGLTSVSDIKLVTLNGPVICDLNHDGQRNQDVTHLQITAPSRFEFDPKTNVGTFHGMLGSGDFTQADVLVKRFSEGEPDRMWCPELTVEFHPKIEPETGRVEDSRLRLGKVSAVGSESRRVRFLSPEHDVGARMMQLDYLVGARRLDMFGTLQDGRSATEHKKQLVRILQQGKELLVPHLRVLHGVGTGIERIECLGRGYIRQSGELTREQDESARVQQVAASVVWNRQLSVQRGAEGMTHTMSLQGGGIVALPERQMRLAGRTINMTLLTATDAEKFGSSTEFSLSMTEAQPKKLIAKGDVIIRSPQVSGELKDQLTVYFHPGGDSSDNTVSVISQSKEFSPSEEDSGSKAVVQQERDRGHTEFLGKEMTAHVVLSQKSDTEQTWSSVRLTGDVKVEHHGLDPDDEYTAEGSTFIAENGLGELADIKLFGSPAILKSLTGHVEGLRIDLHQAEDVAEINGSGKLRMVMDQDLDGKQLPGPVPMLIYWTDHMDVRDRQAHFVGGIRIEFEGVQYAASDQQIHDTEIRTPELKVYFAEPISLTGGQRPGQLVATAGQSSHSPEVKRIQCVGKTIIHQESFTAGSKDGLLDAEMVDLTIWPDTGRFSGIGPGWIESTMTNSDSDSRNRRLQPVTQIRVKANHPTEIRESPFARIKASFIGRMEGNLNEREARLRNFVNITFVPVQDLDDKIDLESIPAEEMPEDSRVLQAEEVYLVAIPGTDGDEFSMTALGNARLESRDLSGDADKITYDHSKSQIVLTGEAGRMVNGRHRPSGKGPLQIMKGPWFEYNLETRQLRSKNFLLDAAN